MVLGRKGANVKRAKQNEIEKVMWTALGGIYFGTYIHGYPK